MAQFATDHFSIRYETWGIPNATPILFFHGFPGSHVQARGLSPFIDSHKIFLIAADRPGYGETLGSGSPADYLKGLAKLLTKLNVQKVHVLGLSGGAPMAHLMASQFSDRTQSLTIVCGLSSFNRHTQGYFSDFQRRALNLTRWMPPPITSRIVDRALRKFNPDQKLQRFAKMLDLSDQEILMRPNNRDLLMSSMTEARRQGSKGILNDARLYRTDWLRKHCDLARLRALPTTYFHGQRDLLLNHRMSEWMNETHGRSQLVLFEDEGHYSLAFQKAPAILSKITSR